MSFVAYSLVSHRVVARLPVPAPTGFFANASFIVVVRVCLPPLPSAF
jgi:hypothetical protein